METVSVVIKDSGSRVTCVHIPVSVLTNRVTSGELFNLSVSVFLSVSGKQKNGPCLKIK